MSSWLMILFFLFLSPMSVSSQLTVSDSPSVNNTYTPYSCNQYKDDNCSCNSNDTLDILFLIDTSGSIGKANFQYNKLWLEKVITQQIPTQTRIGITLYAKYTNTTSTLTHWDQTALIQHIRGLTLSDAWTATGPALTSAIQQFNVFTDSNRQKLLILQTDGLPCELGNCPYWICDYKQLLLDAAIQTVIIAMGTSITKQYIQCASDHYFEVETYTELELNGVDALSNILCPNTNTDDVGLVDPSFDENENSVFQGFSGVLTCGNQTNGHYNDSAVSFAIRMAYPGDLTFDASNSNFSIKSVYAIFGITPIGFVENDGVLRVNDLGIAGEYIFTIKADTGIHGTFNVHLRCDSDSELKGELAELTSYYQMIVIIFISTFVVLSLFTYLDACFVRINDYFNVSAILSAALQSSDMLSDCFFVMEIDIQKRFHPTLEYELIFWLSVVSIIVPAIIATTQLIYHLKIKWTGDNHVSQWTLKYSAILLFLCVLTGNAFSAVSLLNSHLFQMELFDMGLSKHQLIQFKGNRLWSIVLFENAPQICLQSYYIFLIGSGNRFIVVSSIIFGVLSILITILSVMIEKMVTKRQNDVIIRMKVTGECVIQQSSKCRTLNQELKKRLSVLLCVTKSSVEVMKPTPTLHGFDIMFRIHLSKQREVNTFQSVLEENKDNENLAIIFRESWRLSWCPTVSDIKVIYSHYSDTTLHETKNHIKLQKIRSQSESEIRSDHENEDDFDEKDDVVGSISNAAMPHKSQNTATKRDTLSVDMNIVYGILDDIEVDSHDESGHEESDTKIV